MGSTTQLSSSFRDPSGFVFEHNGEVFRQVNPVYQLEYDQLMQSGLYNELSEGGMLVPHEEMESRVETGLPAHKQLLPVQIPFVSYPYEWCFGQLKDAALLTLDIQRKAMARGMSLKDASCYNVQFMHGKPIWIDTLSFEALHADRPWVAYRQFCQHFLAPLALMAHRDVRFGKWSRLDIDGVPLELASRLLPWRTCLSASLLIHIHLHARAQRAYAGESIERRGRGRSMGSRGLEGVIQSLQGAVRKLGWQPAGTAWADYADQHNYSPPAHEAKRAFVRDQIEAIQPSSVWDLGANTGEYSRIAAGMGVPTVAFDLDYGAVEMNYRAVRSASESQLLPLVLDLTNPSPGIGWNNRERLTLPARGRPDLILALALVHHLAISNNLPLAEIAGFLAGLGERLLIEFVPKSDTQVKRLLANRADIFPEYTRDGFETAFADSFEIERSLALPETDRLLYLMRAVG